MHKYIIMGVQGCGKGTHARLLKESLDLVHLSVGDIFRWHIQSHTKLGARIKRTMAEGQLVSDDVVEEVVKQRMEQHDWNYGFILDGFPRNSRQAAFFLESYDIDAVLRSDVPDAVVLERILNRRLCPTCSLDYNLIFHRPAVANTCDICGGLLIARSDDTPEAVLARLQDYRKRLINRPCASTRECGLCLISGLIGGRGEGLPVVRQKFFDPVDGVDSNARQHIPEPGEWLDRIPLAHGNEAH